MTNSIRNTFIINHAFRKFFVASILIISVVAIAFPTLLARLFGANEELLQIAEEPLRVFSLVFIPFGLIRPLFDISVNNQDDKMSVIIKDVGKPYNPIIKYIPNHIDDVDESQLGMLVVHSLCENVNYKYMNGINCLYLNFKKNK